MEQIRTPSKQGGFNMVELMFALVIIGILAAGIFSVIAGRVDATKAKSFAEEIVQSSMNIAERHATQPAGSRYQGITLDNVSVALTENIRNSVDGAVVNLEWGATATLAPSSPTGAGGNTNFMWTLSGLPRTQCEAMLKVMAAPAQVIMVGGTKIRDRMANDAVTPTDIETACGADAPTNTFQAIF